jgi:hypothetical protein
LSEEPLKSYMSEMKSNYKNHIMFFKIFIIFLTGLVIILLHELTGFGGPMLMSLAYLAVTIPSVILIILLIEYFLRYFRENKE